MEVKNDKALANLYKREQLTKNGELFSLWTIY